MTTQNITPSPETHSSIAQTFWRTVEQHPERPALVLPDYSWSFAQLGRAVSRASQMLNKRLETPNPRIAIVGSNHPAYVIAYFAAQSLGASTVELGRLEPVERLLSIVKQTKASFVLTDRDDLKTALKGHIAAASFEDFLSACETNALQTSHSPKVTQDINSSVVASIVYTSGTTGIPKGVVLTNGNFCFIISAVVEYLKLAQEDRYALVLPLNHTYGKSILLTTFAVGASVVLLENFQNLPNFLQLLVNKECTVFSLVPYHAHVLLKWGNLSKYDLPSLRAITSSANKLPPDTIDALAQALPGIEIFSMYGLTESTTRATYVPPHLLPEKKESCGIPLNGMQLKVVGENGASLPIGQVGEVLLSGPNVMRGYFADPELTSRTLVDGWLRTGDLGRLDKDGFLYLEGRRMDIIKCAGERISPLEIEEVLTRHPEVVEAAVTGSPDPILGEVVHAYVIPQTRSLEEAALRAYCAKHLSQHKIPRQYTFIDSIPKTATGKIQKHLLRGV